MIVKYSKKFETGPYLNRDVGFDIEVHELADGSNIEELAFKTLDRLDAIANKWHKENNPQLVDGGIEYNQNGKYEPTFTLTPIQSVDYKAKERLEILIDDAKTFEQLDELYDDCSKYGLLQQYRIKRESLQPSNTIQNESN